MTSTTPRADTTPLSGAGVQGARNRFGGPRVASGSSPSASSSAPAARAGGSPTNSPSRRGQSSDPNTPRNTPSTHTNPNRALEDRAQPAREHIESNETDGCSKALNVIRRNLKDKGRPLIKMTMLLNEFAKKKTGRTNAH